MAPPTTTPHGAINTSSHVKDSDSFLRLDCEALAECLSTIPLHQVLGISPDFVQLCEMEADTTDSKCAATMPSPAIDLSACTRRKKKEYAFEFKAPPGVSGSVAGWDLGGDDPLVVGDTLEGETFTLIDESAQSGHEKCTASRKGNPQEGKVLRSEQNVTLEGNKKNKSKVHVHSETEQHHSPEDEILDRLLAGSSGPSEEGMSGGSVHTKAGRSKGSSGELVHNKAPLAPSKHPSQGTPAIPPLIHGRGAPHDGVRSTPSDKSAQGTSDTAELDDMLDDLLS